MGIIQSYKNPFPGIRSFEPEEDYLFFGRDKQLKQLIPMLYDIRFLAITGSSGCGKSSLVRAGLIPSLFKNKYRISEYPWSLTVLKPGNNPIRNLAEALFELFKAENCIPEKFSDPDRLVDFLVNHNDGLLVIFDQLNKKTAKNRLLFIDQFEEIFRYKQTDQVYHKEEADTFLNLFLFALHQTTLPIYTSLTMRSDFLGDCTDFTGLADVINKGHYLVARMNEYEKEEAIREPISICNGTITDRLVEKLLSDLGDDPDQLPVMQHALMRTWDYWLAGEDVKEPLDIRHYEAIGTMKDAISVHAESVYNNIRESWEKDITEKIFRALINVEQDDSGRSTRRPTKLSEIFLLTEAREDDVIGIIDKFRAQNFSFLMPLPKVRLKPEVVIDITHESIMRKWERLKEWINDEVKSAQMYQRLSKASELYQEGKAALWKNPELQVALKWQETNKPNVTWACRYNPAFERAMNFLNHSRQEYERELAEKENRQKRELRKARRFAIVLGAASVISIIFLLISLNLRFKAEASEKNAIEKEKIALAETRIADLQRKDATVQKRISEQQQQIAEQQRILTEEQKEYAIAQQQIALEQKREAEKQKQLADAAKVAAIKARDEAEEQRQAAIIQKQIAEEERTKAENSEKNTMRLRLLAIARSMAIQSIKLQNTDKSDLPGLLALQAYLFNNRNKGNEKDPEIFTALSMSAGGNSVIRIHQDAVRALAVSPDRQYAASASDDGSVKLLNLDDLREVSGKIQSVPRSSGFRSVSFNSSGSKLLAGTVEGRTYLWDLNLNEAPLLFTGHYGIVNFVCFDKSGRFVITADNNGLLLKQDTENKLPDQVLHKAGMKLSAATYNAALNMLVLGFEDGTIKSMNPDDPEEIRIIKENSMPVRSLTLHPNDALLAAGYSSGLIYIWDIKNNSRRYAELVGHVSSVNFLQFSSAGNTLSSVSSDRTIRLWDYRNTENLPVSIEAHDSWIWAGAFNPDGTIIYSAGADKTIRAWKIEPAQLAENIRKKLTRNMLPDEWSKYVSPDIKYEKTTPELP